jgi:tRNA A-37 threonylcarbamoyl transferase component Bud32/tetratricopeptide (TPR) repeat protein
MRPVSDANHIAPGTRLGPYTLGEQLGHGASATVYLGQATDGRPYAVKVRRRGQPEMDRRFLREFESMRLLRVPGVVPVHEAGTEGEYLWFSMDRVFGEPFHTPVLREPYLIERVERVVEMGRQLCTVLSSLHEAGFVHRDVKPSNVLVDRGGDVHVLDFGIGRYFSDQDTLSNSGEVLGTVPYMAPEQLAGLPTDEKTDLFAVGLMLHESIAGKRKRPLTTVGWIPRICLERLPALATLHREVPRGLSNLIEALLAVDPRDRPTGREAALELRRVASGMPSAEWPAPVYADPGEWWLPLEGCIGHSEHAPVWILEGPSGSGRSRIAEQLHRLALLQGTWTVHLHCRIDRVGGPMLELLEVLLAGLDDEALAGVIGTAAGALRQLWPHLPLPLPRGAREPPSTGRIVDALAGIVERAAELRPMLLVVHDLERLDRFSARLLPLLAELSGENLGVLVVHESRWATPASRQLVATLRRLHGAAVLTVPRYPESVANEIASSICPEAPPTPFNRPTSPRKAVEAGWEALAAWRAEEFPKPEASLWPLTIRDAPVPLTLYRSLVGRKAESSAWVRVDEEGVRLAGRTARALACPRLGNLKRSAVGLASAWERSLADQAAQGDLATLWMLGGDTNKAYEPAARAAIQADRFDLFADARQWLLLLDTLPPSPKRGPELEFELAWVQARVALRTDPLHSRSSLADVADNLARSDEHEHRVRLLRSEFQLREGVLRPSLVAALRVGSSSSGAPPEVQAAALLVAVRARLALGQVPEALRDLERAEEIVKTHPDPILGVQVSNQRADLVFLQHDLLWCRALCQKNIRMASQHRYVRGVAAAAHRLGGVLRMLGRRREAEHHIRSAREAFAATGDLYLDAETGLALATLMVERGEPLTARHLLDETIRGIRGLYLEHLLPMAMRVTLQIATLTSDPTDAAMALSSLEQEGEDEAPAAMVHWWRSRGDVDRALSVVGPEQDRTYGAVRWQLERSRAALTGGQLELAEQEARGALDRAVDLGFAELQTYGRLVLGALADLDDEGWAELQRLATASMYTEVFLGALEMDARRRHRTDPEGAKTRWRSLLARARELGYRPGVEEASGWLGDEA